MISLQKLDLPADLKDKLEEKTTRYLQLIETSADVPDSLLSAYRDRPVKDLLLKETSSKCAYCESKLTHVYFGDVEHIIPKSVEPSLRFEYQNLTLVCAVCNNSKRDYFSPEVPIINPYTDNPEDCLIPLGPLVYSSPGHERARVTEWKLKLNRTELIERRTERLESLHRLAHQYKSLPAGELRNIIEEQLRIEAEADKEYAFCVRGYLTQIFPAA